MTHAPGQRRVGCSVEGCERKHYGHGMCNLHWRRSMDDGRRPRKPPSAKTRKTQVARQRKNATGWTQEQFDAAMVAQGGQCAMCFQPFDQSRGGKAVADHDHATGKQRALLHARCNLYVGVYENNKRAIEAYLEQHGTN